MGRLNRAEIIGNLGADPEVRSFPNGDKVANLRCATTERWTDRNTGQTQERTEWHSVTILGGLVKVAEQYLRKGDPVYLSGKLRTRKWQDRDGVDRYTTEIVVDGFGGTLELLGGRRDGGQRDSGGDGGGHGDHRNPPPPRDLDDEIPF